jgi:hypothetical protein
VSWDEPKDRGPGPIPCLQGKWVAVNAPDDPSPVAAPEDSGAWVYARRAISEAIAEESLSGLPAALQRICRAATWSLSLIGAAVQVSTGSGGVVVLASSDRASRRLGEVTFEVGEGPCLEALAFARPVLVSDLMGEGLARWPGYVSAVRDNGVRAVFALPLHVGAVRLGVLEMYGARVRSLSPVELSIALAFTRAATDSLVDSPSGLSVALLGDRSMQAMGDRIEIHQAQGMVTVDLGVDLAEALALMRAHAFGVGLPLLEVARRILAGERLQVP